MFLRERDFLTRLMRTRPLVTAALLYLLGCILQYASKLPQKLSLIALAGCACMAALLWRHKRLMALFLLLLFLPLGALRFEADWRALEPLDAKRRVELEGIISDMPFWNEETQRCICELSELRIDGAAVDGRIRLYLRDDAPEALQAISLGQRVRAAARLWRPMEASNPEQHSAANMLRLRGLRGYATAKLSDVALSEPEGRLNAPLIALRQAIGARIDRLFPDNSDVARAFILGDRSRMQSEDREDYSDSGAAHLLAISGMHVSAIAFVLNLLLSRLLRRNCAFCCVLALLAAYGMLIGFSASITRAILMFAISGFAAACGRYSDAPTRLSAAMLIYLLIRPIAIIDAGFILSYAASAGLILLTAPLSRLLRLEAPSYRREKGRMLRGLWKKLWRWTRGMLAATLAAQLALLPAVVHFFGAQPLWSVAVNLLCVPLAMLAYVVSLVGLITGLTPIALSADWLFSRLNDIVRFFAGLPLSTLRIARFPLWLTILCALILLLSSALTRLPERLRRYLPFSLLIAILISNLCAGLTTRGVSIMFMDAGQADCALIRTEGKVYLVDVGDAYTPAKDYLSAMNYHLDGVFLTHAHSDHAGGLAALLEAAVPDVIYLPHSFYAYEMDEGVSEALAAAQASGAQLAFLDAGDEVQLSEKTILRVLSPKAGFLADSENDDSMILRMESMGCSALLCADASASVVEGLSEKTDILKLGHHGSAKSVSPRLLSELAPSVAIVSVGENDYGHPDDSAMELLAATGAQICRTDRRGAIDIRFADDGALSLRSYFQSEDNDALE